MGLVVVSVGMAGRPAYADTLSIVPPIEPLTPRYLPQTLALAPTDVPRLHPAVRLAQVAVTGPITRGPGFYASLKEWAWTGFVVSVLLIDAVLTPRD